MVCAMKKAGVLLILFIVVLLVAVFAEAQQPKKMLRVCYLGNTTSGRDVASTPFRERLRELGYPEGAILAITNGYAAFHAGRQDEISHYFRNLYNLFKYLSISKLENPQLYANLVRAQLSTYELLLLFYSCLSDLGIEKFKPLVEQFGVLEGLAVEKLIERDHLKFYAWKAYGDKGFTYLGVS
jgi:Putative phage abortive infection protein